MSNPIRKIVLLLAAVVFTGGCEQLYTGGIALKGFEKEQVDAYQKFKDDQAVTVNGDQQAQSAQPGAAGDASMPSSMQPSMPLEAFDTADAQVSRDMPGPAGGRQVAPVANTPGSAMPVAANTIAPNAYAPNRSTDIANLGLYGRVDQAAFPGRTSPLDATGDITQMTFTLEGADFDPDVDPTGGFIVYASTRHRDTADLYVKRIDGSAVTQLTADPANEIMPTYSPDGEWVAFASNRTGSFDIYLMPARGGQPKQLTNDPAVDLHPSFSSDGRSLVYSSLGSASGQWEMIVIDVANPSTKRVIGHGLFPMWNPTGDTILFQRARQRGTKWFSVWTMQLVNGEPAPPTEIAVSANAAVITPDWSPDGKQVVFCTVIDPEADQGTGPVQADLWVTASDGTGRVKLTNGRCANLQPSWSKDGTIYFVSDRGANGVENIWAVRPGRALDLAQPAGTASPASAEVPTE